MKIAKNVIYNAVFLLTNAKEMYTVVFLTFLNFHLTALLICNIILTQLSADSDTHMRKREREQSEVN